MVEQLFVPLAGVGELILRLTIALVFWPHGWQKLKGPAGFAGFLKQLGVPAPVLAAWVVALLESVGALLLVLGLATRIVALGLAVDMLVAIVSVKIGMAKSPFASTQQVQGWEFEFALMGSALALVFMGAGRLSIDALLGL
jgi:putative oxidoreductase